jgi:hypothetical protein
MTGAAIGLVVFLAYVLLVQSLMAAAVILAEFTILRIRALQALLRAGERPTTPAEPQERQAPVLAERPAYRLGGDVRWY